MIADALLRQLGEHSLEEVSGIDIIENSSISKGTFYKYFKDKEDVFRFICVRFFRDLFLQVKRCQETSFRDTSFFSYLNLCKKDFHSLMNAYEDKCYAIFYLKMTAKDCFDKNDGLLLDVILDFLCEEEDCTKERFKEASLKKEKEAESSLLRLRRFLK